MKLAFLLISIVIFLGVFGYAVYRAVKLVKIPHNNIDYKKEMIWLGALTLGASIVFVILSALIYVFEGLSPYPYESAQAYIGGFLFALSFVSFILTFIVHYYRKNLPEKLNKWLYRIMMISIPMTLIMMFLWSNGYADYIPYPLPNGFWFTTGLTYPSPSEGNHIAFYAIMILSGALFVYFLCDHRFYQEYGKHGILESTFLVALPAGIIGARIGYVIGNWEKDFAGQAWWKVFDMRTGGLTIISGALIGIVVGVAWFMWRNKKYSIWMAVDIIVPTILLAQAIGRWGNFFNVEVHGVAVSEEYFAWLPKIIFNNIHYSSAHYVGNTLTPLVGQVYVPLFLIEGITNTIGYFVLAYLFGKVLRKWTELGDLAFGYPIWYGLTRVIMEPLRDGAFNMGNDGYWSWFWSLLFVVIGVVLICLNHIIRHLLRKKKAQVTPKASWMLGSGITSAVLLGVGLSFFITGVIMVASSPVTTTLAFTPYTKGLIFLILGIAVLLGLSVSLMYFIDGYKAKKALHE